MRIFPTLLAAFVVIPLLEIALFVAASNRIGVWTTLFIVVVTAFVGASLVSRQGRGAVAAVQREFLEGRFPAKELAHGAMILVSGALLVTPGFLTDAIGFSLLVPAVREVIRRWGVRRYRPNVIIIEE
ncbi:MAG: FxsA family protein [Acidimicrobiia bacterium]|nr:FxsA family protein [Acidimicrobiia bacterium]